MSDWAPGDLALCVNDTPCRCCGFAGRKAGRGYTVVGVTVARPGFTDAGDIGLFLQGVAPPHGRAFNAVNFRKIRPHTPDAEDRRTIELLTGKPAKVAA